MERVFTPYPLFSRKERDFYDVSEMRKEPRKGRCPVPGLRRGAGRAVFARHDDRRQNEVLLTPTNVILKTVPVGRGGRRTAIWWIAAIALGAIMLGAIVFAVLAQSGLFAG